MKEYKSGQLKNITLVGHSNSGKTSLAEAILYNAKVTNRLGTVTDGTTMCDYLPEEVKRKVSISTAYAAFEYKNNKVNLLDTPGFPDFYGEIVKTIAASDNVGFVLNAVEGVEATAEKIWENIETQPKKTARFFVVNRMDVEQADYQKTIESIQSLLTKKTIPVLIPIGKEASFKGVVNLLNNKAYIYNNGAVSETDIPADMSGDVEAFRGELMENIAECDDELMEKYFSEGELTDEEILTGFKKGFVSGTIYPVLCCASAANVGVTEIMDFIAKYAPAAADFGEVEVKDLKKKEMVKVKIDDNGPAVGHVFKCMSEQHVGELIFIRLYSGSIESGLELLNPRTGNIERFGTLYYFIGKEKKDIKKVYAGDIVVAVKLKDVKTGDTLCSEKVEYQFPEIAFPPTVLACGVVPKTKADQERCGTVLAKFINEDPTLKTEIKAEFSQLIVHGMGEIHLQILIEKLKANNISVDMTAPKISYRETIRRQVNTEKKYKKQSGGRGQYGHVLMRIEPTFPSETEFEFGSEIFGGSIPTKYVPAIEKGVLEAMTKGILAGYPVVNIKAVVTDGSYHDVDSSDMAFKIAASMAFREGAEKADPALIEPIMEVEIIVPDEYMGDIMGDVSGRRGKILGTSAKGKKQIIKAHIPEAEMYQYINNLRSMTQGRGEFTMKFDHYEYVPSNVMETIIAEAKRDMQEEKE